MKAAFYDRYGAPDVLQIGELPQPVPAAGEVLIKVAVISVNPRDNGIRSGELKWLSGKNFPKLTGADFSGTVVCVGSAVKEFAKGDEVFGYVQSVKDGCSAEYIAVPKQWIAKRVSAISHANAAALPCTYLTALQGLRNKAQIKAGDKVLIYGASGGVGTAAVQLSKFFKAHVTAVCSKKNEDYCRAEGADATWCYDERGSTLPAAQYDIIFQVFSQGGLLYSSMKPLLKPGGCYITLIPSPAAWLQSFLSKLIGQPPLHPLLVKVNNKDLSFLAGLLQAGKIKPHISKIFSLEEIAQAQKIVAGNHTRGKVILTFENDYPAAAPLN